MKIYNKKLICGKRMSYQYNFAKQIAPNTNGKCPENYYACGSGNFKTCVEYNTYCPIRNLEIINSTSELENLVTNNMTNQSTSYIKFSKDFVIKLSIDSLNQPIVGLMAS